MDVKIYNCDRCGDTYNDPRAVRNDTSVNNGVNSICLGAICDKCAEDIYDFILSGKKESKIKVKQYKEK